MTALNWQKQLKMLGVCLKRNSMRLLINQRKRAWSYNHAIVGQNANTILGTPTGMPVMVILVNL